MKGKNDTKVNSQTPEKKNKQNSEKKEKDSTVPEKREQNNRIKENIVETHPASPVPGPKKVPSTSMYYYIIEEIYKCNVWFYKLRLVNKSL